MSMVRWRAWYTALIVAAVASSVPGAVVSEAPRMEVHANDFLQAPPGALQGSSEYEVAIVEGDPAKIGATTLLPSGARLFVSAGGAVIYDPAGAFDRLDPGETATDRFSYVLNSGLATEAVPWDDAFEGRGWQPGADGSYTHLPADGTPLVARLPQLRPGTVYRIGFTLRQRDEGNVRVAFRDTNGDLHGQVAASGAGRHTIYLLAPPAAHSLQFDPKHSFDGAVEDVVLEQVSLEGAVRHQEISILPSEEVGPNLIGTGVLEGDGWSDDGGGAHAHRPGSTEPLEAPVAALRPDAVYLLAYTVTGRRSGNVAARLDDSGEVVVAASNARHAELVRASGEPRRLRFQPSADFDDTISEIHLRELRVTSDVPPPRMRVAARPGTLVLDWSLEPVGPVPTEADREYAGVLDFSPEFGLRDTTGTGSYQVRLATSSDKRIGISLKGGEFLVVRDTTIVNTMGVHSEEQFQFGITVSDGDPPMMRSFIYDNDIDLGLASNQGRYGDSNADAIVFNSSDPFADAVSFLLSNRLAGGSDAALDIKQQVWSAYNDLGGGYRTVRVHGFASYNGYRDAISGWDNETRGGALWLKDASSRARLFGCSFNGMVYRDPVDMVEEGVVQSDLSDDQAALAVVIWTTVPRFPGPARVAMSQLEFEVRPAGQADWQFLAVPDVGSSGMAGRFRRAVAGMAPGRFEVRARSWFGPYFSPWSEVVAVTVP